MDLVTGALGVLPSKLLELLNHEYNLQKGLRAKIESLSRELESMHAALRKVAAVPRDQLDEQVKVWAREIREASYNMEDILDTFLVRIEGRKPAEPRRLKRAIKKMCHLFHMGKTRHDIAGAIEDIQKQLQEVAERRARYKVDEIVAKPAATSTIDPRLEAMYNEVNHLIGIDKSMAELISMVSSSKGHEVSDKTIKIVSLVGVGGLGKTTLAKAVYDELKPQFGCGAFIPVGRNPDLKKVFRDILLDIDKGKYMFFNWEILDERQLINELRDILRSKSYFIVIDDIREKPSWDKISLAFVENGNGSIIITTTRKLEVATGGIYKLQPLSHDDSKMLLYTRIFGGEGKCPDNERNEVSDKILKKCDGVPLAIITIATLLVGKSREEWSEIHNSIGFGHKHNNQQVESTMKIVSFSYYDLPSHLRACLLYLSAFPEDYYIDKVSLIWKWIAEGFVQNKPGIGLFEAGEGYFIDLVNRSMIQAVELSGDGSIDGCRVHDIILELIRSLSCEENFVTILDNAEGIISGSNGRRLALQNGTMEHARQDKIHIRLPQMRSLISCGCTIGKTALHLRFGLLRVLALEHCEIREGWDGLQHIGNLLHLRYLGIQDTCIRTLPEEIGALKFLQILNLKGTGIEELPSSVGMLTQLVCLRAWEVRAPDGIIGKLTSLEEMQINLRDNDESRRQFMKDLGNLRELRVLRIRNSIHEMDESMQVDFVQSLGSLHKIQQFSIQGPVTVYKVWDVAVLPRHLQHLVLLRMWFSTLPLCINPSSLPSLCHLDMNVYDIDEQGLTILGRLTELRYLRLHTESTARLANVAADGCFQKLRSFFLPISMVHFVVNEDSSVSFTIWNGKHCMAFGSKKKEERRVAPDVMPNLREFYFLVDVQKFMENNSSCDILGLEHLRSLQKVKVHLDCRNALADDAEKEEAALRNAVEAHPNRPILQIYLNNFGMKRLSYVDDKETMK